MLLRPGTEGFFKPVRPAALPNRDDAQHDPDDPEDEPGADGQDSRRAHPRRPEDGKACEGGPREDRDEPEEPG
jgi:hypothetical protein